MTPRTRVVALVAVCGLLGGCASPGLPILDTGVGIDSTGELFVVTTTQVVGACNAAKAVRAETGTWPASAVFTEAQCIAYRDVVERPGKQLFHATVYGWKVAADATGADGGSLDLSAFRETLNGFAALLRLATMKDGGAP